MSSTTFAEVVVLLVGGWIILYNNASSNPLAARGWWMDAMCEIRPRRLAQVWPQGDLQLQAGWLNDDGYLHVNHSSFYR